MQCLFTQMYKVKSCLHTTYSKWAAVAHAQCTHKAVYDLLACLVQHRSYSPLAFRACYSPLGEAIMQQATLLTVFECVCAAVC